jgi:hypothetical protein
MYLLLEHLPWSFNCYFFSCEKQASKPIVYHLYEIHNRIVPNIRKVGDLGLFWIVLILLSHFDFLYIARKSVRPWSSFSHSPHLLSQSLLEADVSNKISMVINKLLCKKSYCHLRTLLKLHWCSYIIMLILHVLISSIITSSCLIPPLILHLMSVESCSRTLFRTLRTFSTYRFIPIVLLQ